MAPLTSTQAELIDRWQDQFPLDPQPYSIVADRLGTREDIVLSDLGELSDRGILSRIGAAVRPNTAGASTLAAMAVEPSRLEAVAEMVSSETGVNHNYEREHTINLWFVVTGRDREAVAEALDRISKRAGLPVLDLPLVRAFHINLGFPISESGVDRLADRSPTNECARRKASGDERLLLAALEDGLGLEQRPYQRLATKLGWSEGDVIDRLGALVDAGIISRFGLIVRHRKLGFVNNAMVVWDIPDEEVEKIGGFFARRPFVSLCYQRPRWLPSWPYNLFCMIHGRDRGEVLDQVGKLQEMADPGWDKAVLFSRRCFKQRGAHLSAR